jgi:hypothetical protein
MAFSFISLKKNSVAQAREHNEICMALHSLVKGKIGPVLNDALHHEGELHSLLTQH